MCSSLDGPGRILGPLGLAEKRLRREPAALQEGGPAGAGAGGALKRTPGRGLLVGMCDARQYQLLQPRPVRGQSPVNGYQLLDFGAGRRLERFGTFVADRPCPTAEGLAKAEPEAWAAADARFERDEPRKGEWLRSREPPDPWTVGHSAMTFELKLTPQGQVGFFPEQADNWDWIRERVRAGAAAGNPRRVLNLFAYTGGSTLAAAAAGAEVVHVDAAKNIVAWARRNAGLSGLEARPIHWIVEDVRKFVRRELRRGSRYDAVILDPPSYGHGRRGEVWRLSKHLAGLLAACAELTGGRPRFVLLTCHTPGFGPDRLAAMTREAFGDDAFASVDAGPLVLTSASGRRLPAGTMVRTAGPFRRSKAPLVSPGRTG